MNRKKLYPWYFASAAALLFFLLCFLPGILGIAYSFTDWNNFTDEINFVGLANYKKIFQGDSEYMGYIGNTVMFTIVTTAMKTVIGLALALLLSQEFIKFKNFHRMIIFSPQVMSYLVVGLVFRSMLHPTTGFLNNFLRGIGLDGLAMNWLTDLKLVFPTVMTVDTWKGMGYIMVVVIAGLMSISPEYYEAASIDGANGWQKLWYITVPMLTPTTFFVLIMLTIQCFKVFDLVYVMTGGGPGNATKTLVNYIYEKAFTTWEFGPASAGAIVLFAIVLVITLIQFSGEKKWSKDL